VIFKKYDRTDPEPARHQESFYEFYDRCKSPAAALIRSELERWAKNYPADCRDELYHRFPGAFESAFFELFLHELFTRQGASVAIHPNVGTKGKRPDFQVVNPPSSQAIIVEAAVCLDEMIGGSQMPMMKSIYDGINEISSPHSFILIHDVILKSGQQPALREIRKSLEGELKRIDPQELLHTTEISGRGQTLCYEDRNVKMILEIVAKKRDVWNRPGRPTIGMPPMTTRWGDGSEAIQNTLSKKAKRYGAVEQPFVIAVNTRGSWGHSERESAGVLFGKEQSYIAAETGELCSRPLHDGFWGNAERPKHTRVSAVVLGCVFPANVGRAKLCAYYNPWAVHPMPESFWCLPTMKLDEGRIVWVDTGLTPGSILGLPHDWPGDLFEERPR